MTEHWTFLGVFAVFGLAFWLVCLAAARREARRRQEGWSERCTRKCQHYPEPHVIQATAETRAWLTILLGPTTPGEGEAADKALGELFRKYAPKAEPRKPEGPERRSDAEELAFLRWWYVMAWPTDDREVLKALWVKNTGKPVPRGYSAEDDLW